MSTYTVSEVYHILCDLEDNPAKCLNKLPLYPQENQTFFYLCNPNTDKSFKRDGYILRNSGSYTNNKIIRTYYSTRNCEFRKIVDKLKSPKCPEKQPLVISYTGDHRAYVIRPHGNSNKIKPYVQKGALYQIVSSTDKIQIEEEENDDSEIEEQIVQNVEIEQMERLPLLQICNIIKTSPGFIWHITLRPGILICFGSKLLKQTMPILEVHTITGTHYNLSYVFTATFPIAFMLHSIGNVDFQTLKNLMKIKQLKESNSDRLGLKQLFLEKQHNLIHLFNSLERIQLNFV
jgi:hypothetical protein